MDTTTRRAWWWVLAVIVVAAIVFIIWSMTNDAANTPLTPNTGGATTTIGTDGLLYPDASD